MRSCWPSRAVREPHRHAVERVSRRWRAGHDSAMGGAATFDLYTASNRQGSSMFKSSFVFVSSSILSFTIVWSLDLFDFWVWLIVAGGRAILETGRGSVDRVGARAAASAMQLSLRIMLFVYLSRCVAQRCWRAAVLCYRCSPASCAGRRCLLLLSTRRLDCGIKSKLLVIDPTKASLAVSIHPDTASSPADGSICRLNPRTLGRRNFFRHLAIAWLTAVDCSR